MPYLGGEGKTLMIALSKFFRSPKPLGKPDPAHAPHDT